MQSSRNDLFVSLKNQDSVNNNRGVKRSRNSSPRSDLDRRRTKRFRPDDYSPNRGRSDDELKRLEEENKKLTEENAKLRLEKDLHKVFDETLHNSLLKELDEKQNAIKVLRKELNSKDILIEDLEKRKEKPRSDKEDKDVKDYIKCTNCVKQFETEDLMKRHLRFECGIM